MHQALLAPYCKFGSLGLLGSSAAAQQMFPIKETNHKERSLLPYMLKLILYDYSSVVPVTTINYFMRWRKPKEFTEVIFSVGLLKK